MELVSCFCVDGSADEDIPIVAFSSPTDQPRFIFVNRFTVSSCSSSMGMYLHCCPINESYHAPPLWSSKWFASPIGDIQGTIG